VNAAFGRFGQRDGRVEDRTQRSLEIISRPQAAHADFMQPDHSLQFGCTLPCALPLEGGNLLLGVLEVGDVDGFSTQQSSALSVGDRKLDGKPSALTIRVGRGFNELDRLVLFKGAQIVRAPLARDVGGKEI
jgi:hypothetical protein